MLEIKIILNNIDYLIPYDYHNRLHGYVSDLLGNETYGKNVNKFIYTNLIGGENIKNGIRFINNPYFIIRIDNNDNETKRRFIDNISKYKELFFGLTVLGVTWENININSKTTFKTIKQSPILVSKKFSFINYLNTNEIKECEDFIINTIKEKAKTSNFKLDNNLTIKILRQHNSKDINYKGIINKGRVFELEINADEETKKFIMLNGIGRSCGCGFGFIN